MYVCMFVQLLCFWIRQHPTYCHHHQISAHYPNVNKYTPGLIYLSVLLYTPMLHWCNSSQVKSLLVWCVAFRFGSVMATRLCKSFRVLDNLQRRTISDDKFASLQFWYEQDISQMWWDLDLLYQSVRKGSKVKHAKKNHWLALFNARAADHTGPKPFQLWSTTDKNVTVLCSVSLMLWM